jgi:hypothetical protein
MGPEQYRRRAPLEECQDGLMENHKSQIHCSAKRILEERIDDPNPIDHLAVLHVFRQQHGAASLPGAVNNE